MTTGKCWVILKWAQTIDGKLAYVKVTDEQRWISNEQSRKDVQKLRQRVQAILVGINTVIADDPLLTIRPSRGRQPTRIILDSSLKISLDCKLLSTAKKSPVLIVSGEQAIQSNPDFVDKIKQKGAQILAVSVQQGRCDIKLLLDELSSRGVQQLLVEGGPTVLASFLKEQLADEVIIYIAPKILGSHGGADINKLLAEFTETIDLYYVDIKRFGDNVRLSGLCNIPLKD